MSVDPDGTLLQVELEGWLPVVGGQSPPNFDNRPLEDPNQMKNNVVSASVTQTIITITRPPVQAATGHEQFKFGN